MNLLTLPIVSPPMTVTSQRSEVEGDMFNSLHAMLRISLAVLCSCTEKWQLLPSLVWITRGTEQSEQRHSSFKVSHTWVLQWHRPSFTVNKFKFYGD